MANKSITKKAAPKIQSTKIGESSPDWDKIFTLAEGVPITGVTIPLKAQALVLKRAEELKDLKNRRHLTFPADYYKSVRALIRNHYPEWETKGSVNKEQGIAAIWRTK